MTSRQLVLPLPARVSLEPDDYFVSSSNHAALTRLQAWPQWPGGMLALIGPPGCGKTHLARLHRTASGAVLWPERGLHLIVEDADGLMGNVASEEALFHAFNEATTNQGSILFTARQPLAAWPVALPDLRTRLNTVVAVDLPPPDDALLFAVLLKHFADRQIARRTASAVAGWLAPRMDRSLEAAGRIVAALDARSLALKRRIDTRMAADILSDPAQTS